jgi:hypothetical protein
LYDIAWRLAAILGTLCANTRLADGAVSQVCDVRSDSFGEKQSLGFPAKIDSCRGTDYGVLSSSIIGPAGRKNVAVLILDDPADVIVLARQINERGRKGA